MTPHLANHHIANRIQADTKSGGDGRIRFAFRSQAANLLYRFCCQLRAGMRLAPTWISLTNAISTRTATAVFHVSHVVIMGAEFQMCRVAASPVIALVANDQAVRDRTIRQRVDQAMGTPQRAIRLELSVSPSCDGALPFPARIGTIRAFDQQPGILRRFPLGAPIAGMRAILPTAIANLCRFWVKQLAAGETRGKIGGHSTVLSSGVTLPAVSAAREHFVAPIIPAGEV